VKYWISLIALIMQCGATLADVSAARDALTQQEDDASEEKSLEEVFEATENTYSLQNKGETSLSYSLSYSYSADQRLEIDIVDRQVRALDVTPSSTHNITNNFSFDYGYKNNLTLGVTVPLSLRYDSVDTLSGSGLGDVSLNARWQPYAYIPGQVTKTFNGSFKTKTGDSPYRTISNKRLATGSGYYSLSGGLSLSKVVDPVMLFGSGNLTYGIPEKDVNQIRSGALLQEVRPGVSLSVSGGFAYSLSYDVSLSMSFQGSYADKSKYVFLSRNTQGRLVNSEVATSSSVSGVFNMSLGIRVSPKTITNIGVGFGMTDDAPDILLSLSMPIDIDGLKAKAE